METTTINAHTVLSCGHVPTPQPAGSAGTGYGSNMRGQTFCYACGERDERTRFDTAGQAREPFVAYVTGDEKQAHGWTITTWTGAKLATVTSAKKIRTPRRDTIHGSHFYAITARDEKGREWYGRSSPGIVISLRRKGA